MALEYDLHKPNFLNWLYMNAEKIIKTFAVQGFHTIGALKTNRLLYPSGMKKKLSELAAELSVTHKNFDLVTVKGRNSSLTPTMSTLPA